MVAASKKLPCNHIFHTACLRSWFQRQQTCPTCRLNILRPVTNNQGNRQQNQPQAAGPQPPQAPQAPGFNPIGKDNNARLCLYMTLRKAKVIALVPC